MRRPGCALNLDATALFAAALVVMPEAAAIAMFGKPDVAHLVPGFAALSVAMAAYSAPFSYFRGANRLIPAVVLATASLAIAPAGTTLMRLFPGDLSSMLVAMARARAAVSMPFLYHSFCSLLHFGDRSPEAILRGVALGCQLTCRYTAPAPPSASLPLGARGWAIAWVQGLTLRRPRGLTRPHAWLATRRLSRRPYHET